MNVVAAPLRQHRVLLAEDDEISQDIVSLLLLSTGIIDLQIVADGRAALEAVQTEDYDLLILDQNLPRITGDRIVRHLRAGNGRNSTTPILRFSAEISAPGERRSLLGLETLLPKPLAGDVFLRTVQHLLQHENGRTAAENPPLGTEADFQIPDAPGGDVDLRAS